MSRSLRNRLFLLAAAAIVPLALVSALALRALSLEQREQGGHAALELARAMALAVDAELGRSMAVLEVLATSPALESGDLAAFGERLRRTAAIQPGWLGASLFDSAGRPVLHSRGEQGSPPPPLAEREGFDEVVSRRRPAVGYVARIAGGEWVVPVRVPVIHGGEVSYVLAALLKPESLLDVVVGRDKLATGLVVTAVDRKGRRVVRWPGQEENIGTPVSGSLQKMIDTGAPEAVGPTQTTEGEPVYSAYTRMPRSGWYMAVGIPKGQVESGASGSALAYGGGVFLSILVGALAALVVARGISVPMRELRRAAQALGRGERPGRTRTRIREIEEVSSAMAAAAEQREAGERERSLLLEREQAARAAAEAANRAKDEFLAMLGHELRNPLAAVSNAAQVLEGAGLREDRRRQAAGIIVRQVRHLARLTDDLLDAARALTGKIVLRREPTNVAEAVGRSLGTLRDAGKMAHHVLVERLEEAWADVDAIRLDQIVANLVVNSTKYTPSGGTIRVSVSREGDEAVIRVADDGIGLPAGLAGRVFELFVQGDRDLDRAHGGLGIGLTLVRRLAELHGGSAGAHSEGTGRGSEFWVRLPAVAARPREEPQPAPARGTGRHVLLIEDNEDARETLALLLQSEGHRVEVAADGQEGLEKAAASRPEIVVVDIGLPAIDGYEVARRLRASGACPYLVALTGYGLPADRQRALDAGFDEHLVKPVEPAALERVLAQLPTPHRAPAREAMAEPAR